MKRILISDWFLTIGITGIFLLIPLHATLVSQEDNAWKTLAKLTYKKEMDEFLGFKVDVPVFSNSITALEGKEISLKGYIIPTESYKSQKEFVFSAFPYNMCYFCGGAGPETIVEVHASEEIEQSSEKITIKGTLRLNSDDINSFMYHLDRAVLSK